MKTAIAGLVVFVSLQLTSPAQRHTPAIQAPTLASESPALLAAQHLTAKGRAPKTGYKRSQFGPAWRDVDHNGCDTRNDVLRRDFIRVVIKARTHGCKVIGGSWIDPYSGQSVEFSSAPSQLDADHVVSLSDAWQTGAQYWSKTQREALANDPLNIVITTASLNRQKSDSDAASWLPPRVAFRCDFVARQVAVKQKYGLWVTSAEKTAIIAILSGPACLHTTLPDGNQRPV
ncbi:MAG: HNH endonuclease family protein [Actinomycetes bacterium]